MLDDDKLAADEQRRLAQLEAVKNKVGGDVRTEIVNQADEVTPADQNRAGELASDLKQRSFREVADTANELDQTRVVARVSQVLDYIFFLIYGLIGLEIILELLGARDSNGFKQFIDMVSAPVLGPFRGLMHDFFAGPFHLMLSYVAALIVYLMLHLAVNGLLRLFAHRKVVV